MKKILLLVLIFNIFLSSSCGVKPFQIADTNGEDDISLAILTDEELLSDNPKSYSYDCTYGGNSKGIDFTCQMFSGVKDLIKYNLKEEKEHTFVVSSSITSGNGELFVIQDGKIIKEIGWIEESEIKIYTKGKISFRVAGESAKIKIHIKIVK